MKVIILAGGYGTRISEETHDKPKPMVLINNVPILWHVMSIYAKQGFTEFIIATGYKSEVIEKWVDKISDPWEIKIMDTGLNSQTGWRILECMKTKPDSKFMATYGDGLGNVNIKKLLNFHNLQSRLATVTAVRPPARFGVLSTQNGVVTRFGEKLQADAGWINGGFLVLEPKVKDYIFDALEPFETGALPRLTDDQQLSAFHHDGFWYPMDTLRDKQELEKIGKMSTPSWLIGI
jgi:glucose-1-phosphate cytidylyltransferase